MGVNLAILPIRGSIWEPLVPALLLHTYQHPLSSKKLDSINCRVPLSALTALIIHPFKDGFVINDAICSFGFTAF